MKGTIRERLAALERARPASVYAFRWHDEPYVTLAGVRYSLADYEARYPDAITIQLTWGDENDDERYSNEGGRGLA